ncbi:SPRY domain-containing protein 7 isoform X1 [Mesocricetus auratus]|uniref:SPRY domain-containing protein 7 n=1 Tax=Mesocricetus auratus TaxID=10036 RepID=A0ABM2X1K9_MESAU|nr:SPRY domain-containing protein 7 isoform X1 [Mesocricetus auratus]
MSASAWCCLRCCRDGGTGHIPLKEMPAVQLDTQHMGTDVVIVKNGRRICGTGGCLASAPLHQNKSYFEFKIQSTGIWGIGVATQKVNLNQIPLGRDMHSLVMRNDGALYHNNEEKNRLPANNLPQEGDVVGITYDHVELNVYLNGKNMHCPASGIRGTVYPVVYDKQSPCASQQVVWHVRGARDAWVLECREQLPNLLPSAEFLRALGLGCFPTLHNG